MSVVLEQLLADFEQFYRPDHRYAGLAQRAREALMRWCGYHHTSTDRADHRAA